MPDGETSSANPEALEAFVNTSMHLDAQLEVGAASLRAANAEFTASCREYATGIDESLADQLQDLAHRNTEMSLWVRQVAEQFRQADTGHVDPATTPTVVPESAGFLDATSRFGLTELSAHFADDHAELLTRASEADELNTRVFGALEPADLATGQTLSVSPQGWDVIPAVPIDPARLDAAALEMEIRREELARFLSPLDAFDTASEQQPDGWNVAFDGLKLVLKAIGDAPGQCNDAFARVAMASARGPDEVRKALKNNPECSQSRTLVRITGFLADGTPIDVQAETTLDQFSQQMTAMADSLNGGGGTGRSGWGASYEEGLANTRRGKDFEVLVEATLRRLGKVPFFRPTRRAGGFDLVTLEDSVVVLNQETFGLDVSGTVVLNEAKIQNQLRYADLTAITVNIRSNVQEVIDSIETSKGLSTAEKSYIQSTLQAYLRDGKASNLRVRLITGKASTGPRIQARVAAANGLPFDVVDVSEFVDDPQAQVPVVIDPTVVGPVEVPR